METNGKEILNKPTPHVDMNLILPEKEVGNLDILTEEQLTSGRSSTNGSCIEGWNTKNDHADEGDAYALFKRKGNFFAIAFIPLGLFGVLAVLNHLVTYLYTGSWNRAAAALALGVCEDPAQYETKTTKAVIDAHAFMGITVVVAVAIQVLTGNLMHFRLFQSEQEGSSKTNLSNFLTIQAHKKGGLLVVTVWIACAILGLIFVFVSGHWDYSYDYQYSLQRIVTAVVVFGLIGIATVSNIVLGAKSVLFLDKDDGYRRNRQLFEHKALMFFGIFWITGSALDECLMSIVQLIVQDCYIDTLGIVACTAVGQTLQVSAIVVGAWKYEKSIIHDHTFVRVNIGLLVLRICAIWISLIYLLATDSSGSTAGTPSCFEE